MRAIFVDGKYDGMKTQTMHIMKSTQFYNVIGITDNNIPVIRNYTINQVDDDLVIYKCVCHEIMVTKLSQLYGSIDLLTACLMRNNNLTYDQAESLSAMLNSSDAIFDRFIDSILDDIK